jgi:hypothetical protein
MELPKELFDSGAAFMTALLGYWIADIQHRRQAIEKQGAQDEREKIEIIIREETKQALRDTVSEAIGNHMGVLRREQAASLSRNEVKLSDAIGRWQTESGLAREERKAISDRLSDLYLAIQNLGQQVMAFAKLWN